MLEERVATNQRKKDRRLTKRLQSSCWRKRRPSHIVKKIANQKLNVVILRSTPDVLCHIFELHCKDSPPVTFPLNHKLWEPVPPQIILSHVCSAWRDIILNVPTVWSSIRIVPMNFDTPQISVSVVKAANIWLSQAKGLPCSIDIDFPEADGTWDNHLSSLWKMDWHENIIRDLISLHKFKKLCVTFADYHLRDLLQLPDDKLSCIEDLYLQYISPRGHDKASVLDLHKLSNLTSFSLLPNPFDLDSIYDLLEGYSKLAGIPWHNLRHIHLRTIMPVHFCLDALEHSAVLETCSLFIIEDHTATSWPRALPLHLSQLQQLEVIVYPLLRCGEILESFLLLLCFPRLSSLTLSLFSPLYPPTMLIDFQMLLWVRDASQMHLEELIIPNSTFGIDVRTVLL
ncbi:hypothetical protein JOM56_009010 [Amanita muscaria]